MYLPLIHLSIPKDEVLLDERNEVPTCPLDIYFEIKSTKKITRHVCFNNNKNVCIVILG